jgi:hypothetical protein
MTYARRNHVTEAKLTNLFISIFYDLAMTVQFVDVGILFLIVEYLSITYYLSHLRTHYHANNNSNNYSALVCLTFYVSPTQHTLCS